MEGVLQSHVMGDMEREVQTGGDHLNLGKMEEEGK